VSLKAQTLHQTVSGAKSVAATDGENKEAVQKGTD
jgi:hypothetical protein